MAVAQWNTWRDVFANLAYMIAAGMLIVVTGLAMFVSIRSLKVSRDGLEASGGDSTRDGDTVTVNGGWAMTVVSLVKYKENSPHWEGR